MKKIGIFSGTFDPVHEGHISFAHEAISKCGLDKVFFLIEPRPRRKQGVKAFEHRAAMVGKVVRGESCFGSIVLHQARFSINETLPILQARFKGAELYMLTGEDVLMHLVNWPHVKDLVDAVHFIIGIRKYSPGDLEKHIDVLQKTRGLKFKYTIFQAKNAEVSSSVLRSELRKGRQPRGLNPAVLRYIRKYQLYSTSGV